MANGTGLILVVMCLATFMAILDTSLVNLGLRSIQQDLHADTAALQWVVTISLTRCSFSPEALSVISMEDAAFSF